MMFSSRAAAAKANILFDTGASNNFVSKTFAKQTGIMVRPVEYYICLADDKTTEVALRPQCMSSKEHFSNQ
jgi:hypothetical protein